MAAAYDKYDYPAYWHKREYEHLAEMYAIRSLLENIPNIDAALEIGAGFGRLAPSYLYRAKKITLTDPSARLLKKARKNLSDKKIKYIQASAERLPGKIRNKSVDFILCVRVSHHITDLDNLFFIVNKLLLDNGYFIFEFPNKRHWKAVLIEFFRGNFTFALDIFPKELGKKGNKKRETLPFVNYHPDIIFKKIEDSGMKIITTRSVSNIRIPFLKKLISTRVLVSIEKKLQKPFAKMCFGPSIFVLSKKTGAVNNQK